MHGMPSEQRYRQIARAKVRAIARRVDALPRWLGLDSPEYNTFDLANFRVKEIAHEEVLGELHPPKVFQSLDGGWFVH